MEIAEEGPVECLDDDLIDEIAPGEEVGEGLGVSCFTFDESHAAALDKLEGGEERGEGFVWEGRLEAQAGPEGDEFVCRPIGDSEIFAVPALGGVGGAVEGAIVDDDGDGITGMVVIEFDEVDPGEEGVMEGGQGILGGESGVATVADDQGAR